MTDEWTDAQAKEFADALVENLLERESSADIMTGEYICPYCHQLVPVNEVHYCRDPVAGVNFTYTYPSDTDLTRVAVALERIACSLERIAR